MKDHQSGQKNGIPMLASACPGKGGDDSIMPYFFAEFLTEGLR